MTVAVRGDPLAYNATVLLIVFLAGASAFSGLLETRHSLEQEGTTARSRRVVRIVPVKGTNRVSDRKWSILEDCLASADGESGNQHKLPADLAGRAGQAIEHGDLGGAEMFGLGEHVQGSQIRERRQVFRLAKRSKLSKGGQTVDNSVVRATGFRNAKGVDF